MKPTRSTTLTLRSFSARRIGVLMLAFGALVLSLCATMTAQAEPPVGVTPTVIGRATYDAFDLQSELGFAARRRAHSTSSCGRMTTRREARRDGIRIRVRFSSQSLKAK